MQVETESWPSITLLERRALGDRGEPRLSSGDESYMVYEFCHMAVSGPDWRNKLATDLMHLPMETIGLYVVGLDTISDVWVSLPESATSDLASKSSVHLFRETAKRSQSHAIPLTTAIATMMLVARLNRPILIDNFVSHLLYIQELIEEPQRASPSNDAVDEAAALFPRISVAFPEVMSCTVSDFSFLRDE